MVRQENFGLQLENILVDKDLFKGDYPYKSTGNILKKGYHEERILCYDFKRPDKFTFKQLLNLKGVHERFIDNIVFNIEQKNIKARIQEVNQLAFYEFFAQMENHNIDIVRFFTKAKSAWNLKHIQLKSAKHQLSNETQRRMEKLINKRYANHMEHRFQRFVMLVFEEENPFVEKDIFETSFKKAWEYIGHVEPEIIKRNADIEKTKDLLPKMDMICIVRIEYEMNNKKKHLIIVYPYITIEDFLNRLEHSVI